MIGMLKKIYRKLLGQESNDSVQKLLKTGNIKVGTGCNIDSLKVSGHQFVNGKENIIIGDECYLMCNIVLLNPNAKVKIGNRVFIAESIIYCYGEIEIQDDVMFSWDCTVIDTNAHSVTWAGRSNDVRDWLKGPQYKDWSNVQHGKIVIGQKSWIGFKSIITKNVTIAEGTVVGCGSVVTKSTEPFTVVGGNPAEFIKHTS